jgi:hypothetical protein
MFDRSLQVNPAFAGTHRCPYLTLYHNYNALAKQHGSFIQFDRKIRRNSIGFSMGFHSGKNGARINKQASLYYSRIIPLTRKHSFSFGAGIKMEEHNFSYSVSTFQIYEEGKDSTLNISPVYSYQGNAGALFYSSKLIIGLSVENIPARNRQEKENYLPAVLNVFAFHDLRFDLASVYFRGAFRKVIGAAGEAGTMLQDYNLWSGYADYQRSRYSEGLKTGIGMTILPSRISYLHVRAGMKKNNMNFLISYGHSFGIPGRVGIFETSLNYFFHCRIPHKRFVTGTLSF